MAEVEETSVETKQAETEETEQANTEANLLDQAAESILDSLSSANKAISIHDMPKLDKQPEGEYMIVELKDADIRGNNNTTWRLYITKDTPVNEIHGAAMQVAQLTQAMGWTMLSVDDQDTGVNMILHKGVPTVYEGAKKAGELLGEVFMHTETLRCKIQIDGSKKTTGFSTMRIPTNH